MVFKYANLDTNVQKRGLCVCEVVTVLVEVLIGFCERTTELITSLLSLCFTGTYDQSGVF